MSLGRVIVAVSLLVGLVTGCAPHSQQSIAYHAPANPTVTVEVMRQQGLFISPAGEYQVELAASEMGGWLGLFLKRKTRTPNQAIAKDVTGIAWLSDNLLVYSVSPIYGSPGIFVLDCQSASVKTLVAPENINPVYPQGADYFELSKVLLDRRKVLYYYAPDVDQVDFENFRNPTSLLAVSFKGSE